MMTKLLI